MTFHAPSSSLVTPLRLIPSIHLLYLGPFSASRPLLGQIQLFYHGGSVTVLLYHQHATFKGTMYYTIFSYNLKLLIDIGSFKSWSMVDIQLHKTFGGGDCPFLKSKMQNSRISLYLRNGTRCSFLYEVAFFNKNCLYRVEK